MAIYTTDPLSRVKFGQGSGRPFLLQFEIRQDRTKQGDYVRSSGKGPDQHVFRSLPKLTLHRDSRSADGGEPGYDVVVGHPDLDDPVAVLSAYDGPFTVDDPGDVSEQTRIGGNYGLGHPSPIEGPLPTVCPVAPVERIPGRVERFGNYVDTLTGVDSGDRFGHGSFRQTRPLRRRDARPSSVVVDGFDRHAEFPGQVVRQTAISQTVKDCL